MNKFLVSSLVLFSSIFVIGGCSWESSSPKVSLETALSSENDEENGKIMTHVQSLKDPLQLAEYAKSPNQGVRAYVAMNSFAPKETLETLSHDASPIVRQYLGANRGVDLEILNTLSSDSDADVRGTVAKNPTTPENTLKKFIGDAENVQELLVSNTNLSEALLLQIAKEMKNPRPLEVLAKRSDLPKSVQEELKKSSFESVRNAMNGVSPTPFVPAENIQVQTE